MGFFISDMIYTLVIFGDPHSSQGGNSAYKFAQAALKKEHSIYRVFFYFSAVEIGNSLPVTQTEQVNITEQWSKLAITHNIELILCSAVAVRRGVFDPQHAEMFNRPYSNVNPPFNLGGLGQLTDGIFLSDRVITFK